MNRYFTLSAEQQILLLRQTSAKVGLPEQAIEKDLWVTVILQVLFSLPYADKLLFKGGTTLAKAGLIDRFSEDIDLAIDRSMFGYEGDLTKKQLKTLRKKSSLFVRDELALDLRRALEENGLGALCEVEAEPAGEGDKTYPEPRKIHVRYHSVFGSPLPYTFSDRAELSKSLIINQLGEIICRCRILNTLIVNKMRDEWFKHGSNHPVITST